MYRRIHVAVATKMISMRLDADLAEWARTYLGEDRRTDLVATLLVALRERRLVIAASPAPACVNDGSDPAWPVLVAINNNGDKMVENSRSQKK